MALLHDFINEMNNYLNGITKDIPLLEAKKLLMYYIDYSRDGEPIGLIDKYDFQCFKEFLDNEENIDFKESNPHFYPINADYVKGNSVNVLLNGSVTGVGNVDFGPDQVALITDYVTGSGNSYKVNAPGFNPVNVDVDLFP